MWRLNVNEPERNTYWIELKPGLTTIGRSAENNVALADLSASRYHAKIMVNEAQSEITLHDLNSTNGTYVNRKRVTTVVTLNNNDNIRIGHAILNLTSESGDLRSPVMGTHFFTREIVLESLDEHAVVIDDLAQRLNAILDVQSALDEIIVQLKRVLIVDSGEIILAPQFPSIKDTRALTAIRNRSVEITASKMYVPIISGNVLHGMISLSREKTPRQYSRRDLELAIAISHQAAMTLERLNLLDKNRAQERARELLLRFVSPVEVEYLLKDYLVSGKLPELGEQKATVLFSDIADSTGIAERIGPKHFAELLTRFYQDATEIIFRYGGIIKYIGDGVMACFLSTSQSETELPQEMRAVQAGLQIVNRFKQNGYVYEGETLIVGVAVNTGPTMVGYIGAGSRTEFNVLGDTVNTASRMEAYARPNRLVVGPGTMAVVSEKYTTHRVGELEMRGRRAPIQVFEILEERKSGPLLSVETK